MRLFSWNVNGLRSVSSKGALDAFLANYMPDIICFQEIKMDERQAEAFQKRYADYRHFYNFADKRGYSGTAIWVNKKLLQPDLERVELNFKKTCLIDSYGDAMREGRLLVLKLEELYLVNVYSPHTKRGLERLPLKQKWDGMLLSYLKELEKEKPVVVCGDFNIAHREIDIANPKQNVFNAGFTKEERADFDEFMAAGLTDTFRYLHPDEAGAYTWWTWRANARARNIGWRIDYFLVSSSLKGRLKNAEVHQDVMGSDHCPVSVVLFNK